MFVNFAKVEAFSFSTVELLIRFKKKDLSFLLSTLILLEASLLMIEIRNRKA